MVQNDKLLFFVNFLFIGQDSIDPLSGDFGYFWFSGHLHCEWLICSNRVVDLIKHMAAVKAN